MDYLWTTYAMGSPQRKHSLQESNQEIADRSVHIHTQEFVLRRISFCSQILISIFLSYVVDRIVLMFPKDYFGLELGSDRKVIRDPRSE
jgi:hypothetical protein